VIHFLALTGANGRCQCCGTAEHVHHLDVDLGFVCPECFELLREIGEDLRQLAALQAAMDEELGEGEWSDE